MSAGFALGIGSLTPKKIKNSFSLLDGGVDGVNSVSQGTG